MDPESSSLLCPIAGCKADAVVHQHISSAFAASDICPSLRPLLLSNLHLGVHTSDACLDDGPDQSQRKEADGCEQLDS